MKVVGGDEGTMFWQCLGCGKGCDPKPLLKKQLSLKSFVRLAKKVTKSFEQEKKWLKKHFNEEI